MHTQKREYTNAFDLIKYVLTEEHINLIKVGKNLKKNLINTHEFIDIEEINPEFLEDFLYPGRHIVR